MTEDMLSPVKLERRRPEAMQFTGTYDNTLAIITWIESRGAKATWMKEDYVTHDTRGKLLDEPQWLGERLHVEGKRGFTRFVYIGSWVLLDADDTMQTMTNAVMKRVWKEVEE
jgi:hypothetical protein